MTGHALAIIIIIAAMATCAIAATAIILMLRNCALKYKQTGARGNKTAREIVEGPTTPVLGSRVKFQDAQGIEHDAIVISVHNPKMISLAIADNDDPNAEHYLRNIEKGLPALHITLPLVHRYSYEYTEEERRRYGIPEQSNDLHHHSHIN